MLSALELALAYLLDRTLGDPRWMPHPVRVMGWAIAGLESMLRALMPWGLRLAGGVLVIIIVGGSFGLGHYIMLALRGIATQGAVLAILSSALVIWLASTTIALKGLLDSVAEVFQAAELTEARNKLAMIVGRDTVDLDEDAVGRAALESLAENASDGVVAPVMYLALGGLPLALAYKAINTLDSMVGYKNERYREFGYAAAKLDDLANYIPSRVTGLVIVLTASVLWSFKKGEASRAWQTMLRDGRKHSSPNSGIPEAAAAGALGLSFGGTSHYGGQAVHKPVIGEGLGTGYREGHGRALRLIDATGCIAALIAVLSTMIIRGQWA